MQGDTKSYLSSDDLILIVVLIERKFHFDLFCCQAKQDMERPWWLFSLGMLLLQCSGDFLASSADIRSFSHSE